MEEKRYPKYDEDESVGMCSEPVADNCLATDSGYANTLLEIDDDMSHVLVGRLGFYTEDVEELEARMAEIEAEVDSAEQGDEKDWLTAEEFSQQMMKEFPWLKYKAKTKL